MDVSIESPGSIIRRMTIVIPSGDLDQIIDKKLLQLTKTAKLPGFRPGKIPRKVVESRFSGQVLQEAAEQLIDSSYRDALMERSIVPVGPPSIEAKKMARGEDLEYIATFEVFPEIEKSNIQDQEIEKLICSVEDSDIDRTVQTLLRQHTEWEAEPNPSDVGDRLLIDYVGRIEGEQFDGGEATDYSLILGQSGLLPEFENGLKDQRSGQELTISARFPENYPAKAVAGKNADFTVTIKEVAKPQIPELNEDFIKKFGISEGTEDEFRLQIRKNLEQEAENRVKTMLRESVFNALSHENQFDVPKALVEEEINRGISAVQGQLQQRGLPADESVDREIYRPEAERRVSLALVIREAIRSHDIQPDGSLVRSRIEELAQRYDDPQQVIDWHYADPAHLRQFEGVVAEEQLVEKLLLEAKVVDKAVTFQELMNEGARSVEDATSEQDTEVK